MPRNGTGTYSLPQPPFQAGTVISSAAVNSDFSDIATALTGSLPRDGQAGMSGQMKLTDGSVGTPSLAFNNDLTSGFYRSTGLIGVSIGGVGVGTFTSAGWTGSVAGQNTIQVGTVVDFAGSSAPSGYLLCFGQAVSRTTYTLLFGVIGTVYGSGDGTTTFNVPDLRGLITAGLNNMGGTPAATLNSTYYLADPNTLGTKGGGQNHTQITAEMPSHNHGYTDLGHHHQQQAAPSGGAPNYILSANSSGVISGSNINTLDSSIGITINNAGSSNPMTIVQPSIVMNKMIFAGV